jgi:hypothetical protein
VGPSGNKAVLYYNRKQSYDDIFLLLIFVIAGANLQPITAVFFYLVLKGLIHFTVRTFFNCSIPYEIPVKLAAAFN